MHCHDHKNQVNSFHRIFVKSLAVKFRNAVANWLFRSVLLQLDFCFVTRMAEQGTAFTHPFDLAIETIKKITSSPFFPVVGEAKYLLLERNATRYLNCLAGKETESLSGLHRCPIDDKTLVHFSPEHNVVF